MASSKLRDLGPGLLFAGTAVGVSHLVQSTRAGAGYGLTLLGVIVAANVIKYPAFEAGPRYTAATGRSLLQAYRDQGKWSLWMFIALTVGTMFAVQAAVTLVTAAMASALITNALGITAWSAVLLAASATLLLSGRFHLLESLTKVLMSILSLSTLAAVLLLLGRVDLGALPVWPPLPELTAPNIAFMVALAGWMPTAIDIAVWQSLWGLEKAKTHSRPWTLRAALFDFHVGYIGTALLALCFLLLGAAVLHGRGDLPTKPAAFVASFVNLYAEVLGSWSRPLVLAAAFTTMLSTTVTVADGFPRALAAAFARLRCDERDGEAQTTRAFTVVLLVLCLGALVVISQFADRLKSLVDLATTLSFLTAPALAWLNLRAVTATRMPAEARPNRGLLVFHWVGLVVMGAFAAYFIASRLG